MIRPVTRGDTTALKNVITSVGLFPPDLLDGMLAEYLDGSVDHRWITDDPGVPIGVAYFAPERMTSGTWNLYLIAVHAECQTQGRGAAMVRFVEEALIAIGARVLLIETSSLASFERTRAFYRQCGYDEEARIRDFYQAGEDKIVFRKALA